MRIPPLETERLVICPFIMDDLDAIHQLLDIDLSEAEFGTEGATTRSERERWLQWTIASYEELAKLYQPPYGDRAIVLKQTQQVIGACGFVPSSRAIRAIALVFLSRARSQCSLQHTRIWPVLRPFPVISTSRIHY